MMKNKKIKIFVPGRLCLFGEHSDWASNYNNLTGYSLVTCINLGIYLKAQESEIFIYKYKNQVIELTDLEIEKYKKNDFFEYVVYTIKLLKNKYKVKNLKIECVKMTLPLKKGLASSAAICIAIIKCFNKIYNLSLSLEEEMNLAYEAEKLTGSQCGRMDQICAYGTGMKFIKFNDNKIEIENLILKNSINIILVDLKKNKNTKKILFDLNKTLLYSQNENNLKLFDFFNNINKKLVLKIKKILESDNLLDLGFYIKKYQLEFDINVSPFCEELKSPYLHEFMKWINSQDFVLGSKGVGSQGDGMAQVYIESDKEVFNIIKKIKELFGYDCYHIKIK